MSPSCYNTLMKQDVITMNKKQFNRYEVILRTIDGSLTIEDAAASLNLSARQVKRIKKTNYVKSSDFCKKSQ